VNRVIQWAAIALPIVGLAGLWGMSEYRSRQGTDWEVEIQGYDPRDLLRGHYVEFTYNWPEDGEDAAPINLWWDRDPIERLCLRGDAPVIETAVELNADDSAQGCDAVLKMNPYSVYGQSGLLRGRLYVEQSRASELEKQMADRDQRGIIRIRVRDDGSFTPLDMRFRPLSEEEIADRDGPAEEEAAPEISE
jgi:hypothetical protein